MEQNQQLIIRAQQGDKDALNQLFSNWYKHVYNIAYRYFGDAEAAKEVSQQTFLTVQQKLAGLKDPVSFRLWLYRTVINLCHVEARRNSSRKRSFEKYQRTRSNGQAPSPDALYQRKEQADFVLAALQQIPKEQRTVIIMKEYEGLKFREIADVLEISENTVKSRLYYGLKSLRKFFLLRQISWSAKNEKQW